MTRARTLRMLLILVIAAAFAWGAWLILQTDPPKRKARPDAPAPLVEVLPGRAGSHTLTSTAHGSVRAAHELAIRPQVGGRLLQLHPAFEPGGVIPAGEVLFRIDPADYRLQVQAAEADIAKARAEIAIEQGRRKVAAEELRLLEDSIQVDEASRELALRAPQLNQVRAELLRAQNALQQAKLQLERTQASLSYDAVVLGRDKVAGEVLAARDTIGRIARADRYWVDLQLPPRLLARLHARGRDRAGSRVTIFANNYQYPAEVTRIRAELSENSRLAGVIAEVRDPLGKLPQHQGRPPLLIGSYVRAEIDSGSIADALKLPRTALQGNRRVWVADADQSLQVRSARVLHMDSSHVYIAPLQPGDRVLLNPPSGLAPGTEVRAQAAQ